MTQAGVYVGSDPAALSRYAAWAGRAPDNALAYLNNDSWSAFDNSASWAAGVWKNTSTSVVWSVPLTVWGTSLEQVATGADNGHFLQAAKALAQSKPSSDGAIYVRVGWEFNGTWMPWAAGGHEAAFVKAFQTLVNTFRSVSGQFKFVWDVNEGDSTYNPVKAYPGDPYVDVVGMDTYYNTSWDSADPAAAFRHNVDETYGLQWQQTFAAQHNKATAISEWGVQTDAAGPYVRAMVAWMADHRMVYENYWDSYDAGFNGKLSDGHDPNAGAAYRQMIGTLKQPAAGASPSPAPGPAGGAATQDDTLIVRVSGDSYQGDPHFVVLVDGRQVGGVLSTQASHVAGQTQDVTLHTALTPGAHKIAVGFIDDASGGRPDADRNLYVHQISVDGHVYKGDAAVNTGGYNSKGVANLYFDGKAEFTMADESTLTFRVSGDSYQGDPHFVVRVDGHQVGGVLSTQASHAAGQTQDVTLHTGALAPGPHTVAVGFIDDASGGRPDADRNLYVHQISVDGHTYNGDAAVNSAGYNAHGTANLYANGAAEWHI